MKEPLVQLLSEFQILIAADLTLGCAFIYLKMANKVWGIWKVYFINSYFLFPVIPV